MLPCLDWLCLELAQKGRQGLTESQRDILPCAGHCCGRLGFTCHSPAKHSCPCQKRMGKQPERIISLAEAEAGLSTGGRELCSRSRTKEMRFDDIMWRCIGRGRAHFASVRWPAGVAETAR